MSMSSLCASRQRRDIFSRLTYLTLSRGSKLALLHRVKERTTPSLSELASFAPFSLKMAWSGKSLIVQRVQEFIV